MTTFWRTFHLLNIGVQFSGVALFAWCQSVAPSMVFVIAVIVCCVQGALSLGWVRKAAQTAKGK